MALKQHVLILATGLRALTFPERADCFPDASQENQFERENLIQPWIAYHSIRYPM